MDNTSDIDKPISTPTKTYVDTSVNAIDRSKATIKHFRNSAGLAYDVIDIKNPSLTSLTKRYVPSIDSTAAGNKISAREYNKATGHRYVINADGFLNSDGTPGWDNINVRAVGLQIADNTLYADWDQYIVSTTFIEAAVMMPDGIIQKATKTDGISGAQWVSMGALWSVCWGRWIVEDGVKVNTGTWSNTNTARPILGQKANGDIIIIMIEGKTDVYGATPSVAADLALSYGCVSAYLLDGGGSMQAWWNNCYAIPSSDTTPSTGNYLVERGVVSFLTIDTQSIEEVYDSGMINITLASGFTPMSSAVAALGIRQVGPVMHGFLRASGTFATGASTTIRATSIPKRYFSNMDGPVRWFVSGNASRPMSLSVSGQGIPSVANYSGTANTYAAGGGIWDAPFTDKDSMLPASGA